MFFRCLLKQKQITTFATSLKSMESIFSISIPKKAAYIIGNEARGISPFTEKIVDKLIKIPMPGKAESLNAAVAAGIIIYEALRAKG